MRHKVPAILAFTLIIAMSTLVAQFVTRQSQLIEAQYAQIESEMSAKPVKPVRPVVQ